MKLVSIIFFCVLLSSTITSQSQTVLLKVDRSDSTESKISGPNTRHFLHLFVGFGFILGDAEQGAAIKYFNSNGFEIGLRYKLKITRFNSAGLELSYHTQNFRLKQNDENVLPDTFLYDKERLQFHNLSLGIYHRFNFKPNRGNIMGKFLDVGASAEWIFDVMHYTELENALGEREKIKTKGLDYPEDFTYMVFGRLGINQFSIYVKYRLTDLFKSSYNYPELPLIEAGLQVGLHQ